MSGYFEFMTGLSCSLWVLVTLFVCGLFAVAIGLAKNPVEWRKVFVIAVITYFLGTLAFFVERSETEGALCFFQSRDFTILVIISIFITLILSELLGLIKKKGDGWKIGLTALIALHFGVLAVFYPIF